MALLGVALLVVALLGKGVQKDRSDIRNRRFYLILCLQKNKKTFVTYVSFVLLYLYLLKRQFFCCDGFVGGSFVGKRGTKGQK
jgi:hypothetical protein